MVSWRGSLAATSLICVAGLPGCSSVDPAPVTVSAQPAATPTESASNGATFAAPEEEPANDDPAATPAPRLQRSSPSRPSPSRARRTPTTIPAAPLMPAATRAGVATYMLECDSGVLRQRPRSFTLSCGDTNESLDGLVWESWGKPFIRATGYVVTNPCTPSCADSTPASHPAEVVASDLHGDDAVKVYRRLTITLLGEIPPSMDRVLIYELPPNN